MVARRSSASGSRRPSSSLDKYPTDLSGGQKQRAVIARAIILGPDLLVADEPVSMLDMSVRAKILELMLDLKRELGLTYVYITHDLATAKFFCDRIAIMYLGRIVEIGPTEEIFADPKHPYTQALLRAIPEPDPAAALPRDLPRGEIPDAARPPLGCSFHPRCPEAFEVCGWESARPARRCSSDAGRSSAPTSTSASKTSSATLRCWRRTSAPSAWRGRRESGEEPLAVLEDSCGDPDERFWNGVRRLARSSSRSNRAVGTMDEPRPLEIGPVEVECHLYDAEALAEAERRRAGARPSGAPVASWPVRHVPKFV